MSNKLPYTLVDGIKCYSPEVASDYADYPDSGFDLTDKNAESSFWVSSRNRLFKKIVERHLVPSGRTKFLEIGCGTGDFIQQIAKNDAIDITGSEIYLKGLIYAKRNLPSVDFVQFDATKGIIDEHFQVITAFDVLEHIDNDRAAISNLSQMLGGDGVLIVSVPQHMFLWSKLDEIVKHKRRYSRADLVGKLKANGLDVEYATSFVFVLFPLMLISRIFDRRGARSASDEKALEKRVKFSGALNLIFDFFMRIDEALIAMGASLPFGGTLIVIARKRA